MLVLPYYVLVMLVLPYQRVSYANTMPLNIYGLSFEILNTAIHALVTKQIKFSKVYA